LLFSEAVDAAALATLPLTELVARARDGNALAEGLLCQRFVPAVRAFARRRLRSNEAVEEFSQDVFLAFLPALRRGAIEDPERVGGFLLGICRNLAREGARHGERRRELWDTHGAVLLEVLPEELKAPTELEIKLEDCMSLLSARSRRLLELSYVEELSHEEIAERLEVTPANARVMRHRSLGALRECLNKPLSWVAA
jgi:RNA polymerase sigma-70 factor (ECF subfamily)